MAEAVEMSRVYCEASLPRDVPTPWLCRKIMISRIAF